jgi:integrase
MARKTEGWTLQRDKRNGTYVAQFRIAGKIVRRSTRTDDAIEAKSEAARLYREALAQRKANALTNPQLAELFDRWLDDIAGEINDRYFRTQAARAVKLAERFPTVADVTPQAQRRFHKQRLEEVTATTLKRDLVPLRECLRWAFDEGLIDEPVTVLLPKKRARGTRALDTTRVDLTAEQVEALLVALPERTRAGHRIRDVFTVAWETGLRSGALFKLEAGKHFKRGKRELFVSADIDKAGWERPLPLTERAYQALERNAPDIGPIFKAFNYRKSLRAAARSIGLEDAGLDLRDFRHAATTDAARASGHLLGTSYIAGHVQQGTTSRYVHPRIDDARKVLNARFGEGAAGAAPTAGNGVRFGLSNANDTRCVDSDQGTKNDTYENAKDPECLGC